MENSQNHKIILGLLTSLEGYPLGFEIHEGNCYEGKTFIPMLEKFQKKFNIEKPIVVADSGLLSKTNILELEKLNYRYILGARIKSSSSEIKNKIVSLNLNDEKNIETIYFSKKSKDDSFIFTTKEQKKIDIQEQKL